MNNGTSWTNAWKSFSVINWGSINPGDYIYISGGTDSTVYNETLEPACSGTASNYVTIIAGKYSPSPSGHSGRVIIDGNNTRYGIAFFDQGGNKPSYIIVKGFETKRVEIGVYANFDVGHNCIVLDSLGLYGFINGGVRFETGETGYQNADSLFIQNCRIVSPNYVDGESDGIQLKGVSHVFIDHNYIRIPNQQPTAHVDALQGYLVNGGIITNNVFINDSVYSTEGGGIPIIYGAEGTLPVIMYNNFCYMGGVWYSGGNWAGTLMTRWYDHNPMPPTWILNNTVVSNGPRVRGIWLEYSTPTTTTVINNIIAQYSTTSSGVLDNFDNSTGSNLRVDSIRNNLFYHSWEGDVGFAGNLTGNGRTGTPSGWTDFVNNYGGTGVKGNPLLVSKIGYEPDQGLLNGELQSGSPAINQGEDIELLLNYLNTTYGLNGRLQWTDINGNPRDNTPTIGAYEYSSSGGSGNNPPNQPSNPSPFSGSNNQPVNLTLSWNCSDPDGNPLTYDVYFGTSNNPPITSSNQSAASFNPGQLNNNATYYWKIVAKDNQGHTTSGPIWNFTTQTVVVNNPPNQPSNPNPVNGATGRPVNLTMTWTCTDPDGDPLTYDVYFGTNSNPPIASTNRTSASFTPAQLNYNTTYYWKIVAKDNQGHSTSGTVWNFTTETGGGGDTLVMFPVQNVEGIIIEPDHTPEKTIDGLGALSGDPDSRWAAEPMPEEIVFDLGLNRTVYKTKLSFYNWNAGRIYNYSISISSDHNNWVNIVSQAISASNQEWTIDEFPAVSARYVQVHFINNNQSTWAGLWEGEIWGIDNIVTVNNPPNQPSNPNPVNGATWRPVNLTMTWTCTDPDGDPLTYDVYFGTNSNPPIASTNRTSASFTPAQLNNNTTYYWKIVAKDNQGHSTSGAVWNFKTIYVDTTPPEVTNITVTLAKNVTVNFSEKLNPTYAKNKNNYLISNNVIINSVSLLPDSSSVLIKTSVQQRNREYSITMTNIADKAGNYTNPNPNVVSYFLPKRGPGYMIMIPVNKVIANNFDVNFLPEKTVDGKGMESPDSRWQSSTTMPDTLIFDFGMNLH